jgi:hypothetical protein
MLLTRQPTSSPVGAQEPRIRVVPPTATCDRLGDAALRLVDEVGPDVVDLIPWQEGSILDLCATDHVGQFAASSAGLVVSRQNGKGGVLEVRAVAGVTLPQFGERRILWTAHTWKTARDAHQRVAAIFLAHPDLKARLKHGDERGISYGNDSRSITLRDGSEILFFTRSATAGRGLWADLLICDEALDLTDTELSVLRYTLRTSALRTGRRSQVLYVSTPPDEDKHANGVVFSRLRGRALAGARGVCWLEFSVPTLAELQAAAEAQGRKLLGDPRLPAPEMPLSAETLALWAQGNPSLGYLFDLGTLEGDRVDSGDREFLVEGLAAPDFWPDPDPQTVGELAFDVDAWKARRDPLSRALNPLALGLDVSPKGDAALSVCGWRPDGRKHGELIRAAPGARWALPLLRQIADAQNPATLVLDGAGPAGSLLPEIRAAGFDPQVLSSGERSQADDGLVRDVADDGLRLPAVPMPPLDDAVESATWRNIGTAGARAFDRIAGGAGIAPAVSLSLARFGLLTVAAQPPKPKAGPPPRAIPAEAPAGVGRELDMMSAGF